MDLQHIDIMNIVFQLIAFMFAISVHESAHAWMANLRGDPTARMLGRITLNPIKHIDLFGTLILPAVAMLAHLPVLGWAKPTPVDPRNFKNPMLDDILTSVVGPISNFVIATVALLVLVLIKNASAAGEQIVFGTLQGASFADTNSLLVPLCKLAFAMMIINIVLGVFNLIPVPPLDGSHVVRHLLPAGALRIYDTVGTFGLLLLVFWGGGLLSKLINPVFALFVGLLLRI
ncbi:MAG TPA: site-2 protease family protein [Terriglobales bacterium]|jgi:Zn-dependent protease|nr:site-2 protease family protein [Terriglobales bacterium]